MRMIAVTGASGGHIFPALAFLEEMGEKRPDIRTLLVLPDSLVGTSADFGGQEVKFIPIGALHGGARALPSAWRLCLGSARSLELLLAYKPDLVVGFGSLSCVPLMLSAWMLRIPTMLHEQNVVPGKANRFLGRFVDKVAVSYEESKGLFPVPRRTVFTGNPLRKQMRRIPKDEARAYLGLGPGRFTVLVMGGSQGARSINRLFPAAAAALAPEKAPQVIHISGTAQFAEVTAAYAAAGITAKVYPFLTRMECAYSAADAAVCRAGAITCAELAAYALPALVIPYPFANGHQSRNAAVLERAGCCRIVKDGDLDAAEIGSFLNCCQDGGQFLSRMRSAFPAVDRRDAPARLARAALEACA